MSPRASTRALWTVVALAAVLLCVVAADTVVVIRNHQSVRAFDAFNERLTHSQAQNLTATCIRLDLVRASDNISHYADWLVDRRLLTLGQSIERAQKGAQKRASKALIATLRMAIAQKTWIPVSDCGAHALGELIAPKAVAFNVSLPGAADLK
jgi:hypothetical protein